MWKSVKESHALHVKKVELYKDITWLGIFMQEEYNEFFLVIKLIKVEKPRNIERVCGVENGWISCILHVYMDKAAHKKVKEEE